MEIGLWPTAFPTARAHVFIPSVSFSFRANSPYVVVSPYGIVRSNSQTFILNTVPCGINGRDCGDVLFPAKYSSSQRLTSLNNGKFALFTVIDKSGKCRCPSTYSPVNWLPLETSVNCPTGESCRVIIMQPLVLLFVHNAILYHIKP